VAAVHRFDCSEKPLKKQTNLDFTVFVTVIEDWNNCKVVEKATDV